MQRDSFATLFINKLISIVFLQFSVLCSSHSLLTFDNYNISKAMTNWQFCETTQITWQIDKSTGDKKQAIFTFTYQLGADQRVNHIGHTLLENCRRNDEKKLICLLRWKKWRKIGCTKIKYKFFFFLKKNVHLFCTRNIVESPAGSINRDSILLLSMAYDGCVPLFIYLCILSCDRYNFSLQKIKNKRFSSRFQFSISQILNVNIRDYQKHVTFIFLCIALIYQWMV